MSIEYWNNYKHFIKTNTQLAQRKTKQKNLNTEFKTKDLLLILIEEKNYIESRCGFKPTTRPLYLICKVSYRFNNSLHPPAVESCLSTLYKSPALRSDLDYTGLEQLTRYINRAHNRPNYGPYPPYKSPPRCGVSEALRVFSIHPSRAPDLIVC